MKIYVRFQFHSEGASPIEIIRVMTDLGFKPVMGDYDFYYEIDMAENYKETLRRLHEAVAGLNVMYTLTTVKE